MSLAALLLAVTIVLVVIGVILRRPAPTPEQAMQPLCRSAAEAGLERRGDTDVAVSQSPEVTRVTATEYRVQGTATFRDGDEVRTTDLRCILRAQDGRWRVAVVRFND